MLCHNVLPHEAKHVWAETQLAQLLADRADSIHALAEITARMLMCGGPSAPLADDVFALARGIPGCGRPGHGRTDRGRPRTTTILRCYNASARCWLSWPTA